MVIGRAVCVAILLIFAASARAADTQPSTAPSTQPSTQPAFDSEWGNTLFNLPKGWKKVEKGDTLILIPPDVQDKQPAIIVITPGDKLKADFRKDFDAALAELRGDLRSHITEVKSLK